ncbi:hypothetical protein TNCV_145921 [Trichonephila clavipes]|nr:hypothetical protein TNCV_145921 [Trichonephila clavipes]
MVLLLQEGISDHLSYVIPSRSGVLHLVGGRVHLDDSNHTGKLANLNRVYWLQGQSQDESQLPHIGYKPMSQEERAEVPDNYAHAPMECLDNEG